MWVVFIDIKVDSDVLGTLYGFILPLNAIWISEL